MSAMVTESQVRLLQLLDSAEGAGLCPISVRSLHTFAYFANVLSPVWDLPPLDGKVLKLNGGPFYPALQHDLDRLVGLGIVTISELGHERDEDGHWRLRGCFGLNRSLAAMPLEVIFTFDDERKIGVFLRELALAASTLTDEWLATASRADATFADPLTQPGNVIDFAEWQHRNYSANAANVFRGLMPEGITATNAELLHLYIRHLRSRLGA
jgi:hypothetical protein